jgi:hypothetical protein
MTPFEGYRRSLADDDAAIRNLVGLTALLGDEDDPEDYRGSTHRRDLADGTDHGRMRHTAG